MAAVSAAIVGAATQVWISIGGQSERTLRDSRIVCQYLSLRTDRRKAGSKGTVVPLKPSLARELPASACSCHRQQQNQQPNAAPLHVPPTLISKRRKTLLPCPRAELDSDTILAVGVGVAGIALGIGIPVFYETQVKGSEGRENDQPCFPCNGSGSQTCRFCVGAGNITVELGAGEKEVSKCINCEGAGNITCTTCQGSGVQPRYLDRREYKDED